MVTANLRGIWSHLEEQDSRQMGRDYWIQVNLWLCPWGISWLTEAERHALREGGPFPEVESWTALKRNELNMILMGIPFWLGAQMPPVPTTRIPLPWWTGPSNCESESAFLLLPFETLSSWLSWNLICSPSWPPVRDPPVSWELGLKVCVTSWGQSSQSSQHFR